MEKFEKKVSYIKGLADGLDLDRSKPEGKLIMKMLDVMEEMAAEMEEMKGETELTNAILDDLTKNFAEAMSEAYGDDDDDDELFGGFDMDDDLYEMECPNCHEDVMIEFDMINDDNEIICPNCHKVIPLEFDFDDDFEDED